MMKEELFNYLKSFMVSNEWNNGNTAEQARAMFTTICFVGDIEADSMICDTMLHTLYDESGMEYVMDYDDFESFMIKLIV